MGVLKTILEERNVIFVDCLFAVFSNWFGVLLLFPEKASVDSASRAEPGVLLLGRRDTGYLYAGHCDDCLERRTLD